MGDRRQARELALMLLYQVELTKVDIDLAIERFFAAFDAGEPLDPSPPFVTEKAPPDVWPEPSRQYAEVIVRGVLADLEKIDATIQALSTNWRLDRMARVDRNLLRLGTYEILHPSKEVPRKVVINEAVDIAKRFGTQESGAFVNGILDRVGKK